MSGTPGHGLLSCERPCARLQYGAYHRLPYGRARCLRDAIALHHSRVRNYRKRSPWRRNVTPSITYSAFFVRGNCVPSAGRWGLPMLKKALLFSRRPLNFLKFSGLRGSHCGKPLSKVFMPRLEQFKPFS